jgi:hypothetical protein
MSINYFISTLEMLAMRVRFGPISPVFFPAAKPRVGPPFSNGECPLADEAGSGFGVEGRETKMAGINGLGVG